MVANKTIIISVTLYVSLFIVAVFWFLNTNFSGSDAAGNGMNKSLVSFYGLGVLLLIAILLTIINIFQYKEISLLWVKVLFFLPLALPLATTGIIFFEIGQVKGPSTDEQAHRLTFEIRSTKQLENPSLAFKSTNGGASSTLRYTQMEGDYHFYEKSTIIYFENDRSFYIRSKQIKTKKHFLKIPYEPKVIPFTDWQLLLEMGKDSIKTPKLEFRYKIDKAKNP